MNIGKLIEVLPTSVKANIIDFTDVRMKSGRSGIRVILDRLLTDDEKAEMSKSKHIVGLDCVATYRYAAEIKKSYFYVI